MSFGLAVSIRYACWSGTRRRANQYAVILQRQGPSARPKKFPSIDQFCTDWRWRRAHARRDLRTTELMDSKYLGLPIGAFEARVLRYLWWFGLMEKTRPAANDYWRQPHPIGRRSFMTGCSGLPECGPIGLAHL